MVKQEVVIGAYRLVQKDYADKFWIYVNEPPAEGEGMGVEGKAMEKLIKLIDDFYKDNF